MQDRSLSELARRARQAIREAAAKRGYEITRNNTIKRMGKFMSLLPIDTVFDIGANTGQYGAYLRLMGYQGRIISVEPLSTAYAELAAQAARDPRWDTFRAAVSDQPGTLTMNISGNSVSSSPLPMLASHERADPKSGYVGTEEAPAVTIDQLVTQFGVEPEKTFLKIDVQGYEWTALDGAADTLARFAGAQLELSLVPLYGGQKLMSNVIARMAALDFELWILEMGFWEFETSRTLQCDGCFVRKGMIG